MALHIEKLDGGLVTSRDPSLLQDGELSRAQNAIYRPYSEAIHPIGYRVKIGLQQTDPTSGLPYHITGLRRLLFEDKTKSKTVICDGAGARWRYGPDSNGNWTILPNIGVRANAPIEAVHLGNRYVLANGIDDARVVDPDLNAIPLGMIKTANTDWLGVPVEGVSNVDYRASLDTTATRWENPEGAGFYFYWITEYDAVNDIESAVVASYGDSKWLPPPNAGMLIEYQQLSDTTDNIVITINYGTPNYPNKLNPNATHWRVYRSNAIALTPDPPNPFPVGFRITVWDKPQADDDPTPWTNVPMPEIPGSFVMYDYGYPSTIPYPVYVIEEAGVSSSIDINDPPYHLFDSADVFEDSIVTNDVENRSVIHYSAPNLVHSWPYLYTVTFGSKKSDAVRCIRALGSFLIVGMETQLWRLDMLPRVDDSLFTRSRWKELISPDQGIVGPQAAAAYTIPGDVPQLAFVSQDGLYSTNGMTTRPLTRDLDWLKTFRYGSLSTAILLNAQDMQSLVLLYTPAVVEVGGIPIEPTARSQALYFSYAPEHLKNGMLKVSGPIAIGAASADYDIDDKVLYTGGYDGQVRWEDQVNLQTTQLANAELIDATGMRVRTRLVHLAGLDGEWSLERLHVFSGPVPNPERRVETFSLVTRDIESEPEIEEFGEPFSPGVWSMQEKHVTAGGMGVEIRGFAPITLVGLEHSARR